MVKTIGLVIGRDDTDLPGSKIKQCQEVSVTYSPVLTVHLCPWRASWVDELIQIDFCTLLPWLVLFTQKVVLYTDF